MLHHLQQICLHALALPVLFTAHHSSPDIATIYSLPFYAHFIEHIFIDYQAALWLFIYVATNVYMKLMGPVNMKKKYKADWALVTGAGTGMRVVDHSFILTVHI